MVTKPRSGSLTIGSRFAATSTLIRSAILRARPASATGSSWEGLFGGQGPRCEGPAPTRRCGPLPRGIRSGAGLLAHLVRGDEVAQLEVVERPQVDAALE